MQPEIIKCRRHGRSSLSCRMMSKASANYQLSITNCPKTHQFCRVTEKCSWPGRILASLLDSTCGVCCFPSSRGLHFPRRSPPKCGYLRYAPLPYQKQKCPRDGFVVETGLALRRREPCQRHGETLNRFQRGIPAQVQECHSHMIPVMEGFVGQRSILEARHEFVFAQAHAVLCPI